MVDGSCTDHCRLHPDILRMDPLPGLVPCILCFWMLLLIDGLELATTCPGTVPAARPDDVTGFELTINLEIQ